MNIKHPIEISSLISCLPCGTKILVKNTDNTLFVAVDGMKVVDESDAAIYLPIVRAFDYLTYGRKIKLLKELYPFKLYEVL